MDNVDVGLFDRDWNNAIYFFALNADEQIYMRYGGRESESPDTYNDLESLEVALQQGLDPPSARILPASSRPSRGRSRSSRAKSRCSWSALSPAASASSAT